MVSSASSGKRVLLVEDEMILMLELEEVLTGAGFEVVGPVARVSKALALIVSKPIDAAIVDVNLGDEKSYPIADALIARQVPFFFVTGYDSLEEGYQSIPRLQKPIYPGQLKEMLDAVIMRQARKAQPAGKSLAHPGSDNARTA